MLRCRNATQTSVVLEWDPIQLATADLISLSLYRNGQKAGNIPRPLQMHSTKISGLAVDTEYNFHLVLRTSAGTFSSEKLVVRTHKMTDLSGVTITTGILSGAARERLVAAVERIGAKLVPDAGTVRIDTTHFVTTEGRGTGWEKAVELNIPVVRPEWVEACEKSGRILGVTKFYLDAVRPTGPNDNGPAVPPPQPHHQQQHHQPQHQQQQQQQHHQPQHQPQSPPPQQNKELPKAPSASTTPPAAAPAASSSASASATTAAASTNNEAASSSSTSSSSSTKPAPPARTDADAPETRDDQKVWLGDQAGIEQKVALRPTMDASLEAEKEHEADASQDSEEEDAATSPGHANGNGSLNKPATPGDGNSFQDVDL